MPFVFIGNGAEESIKMISEVWAQHGLHKCLDNWSCQEPWNKLWEQYLGQQGIVGIDSVPLTFDLGGARCAARCSKVTVNHDFWSLFCDNDISTVN